jgi:hypothetical protein
MNGMEWFEVFVKGRKDRNSVPVNLSVKSS